MNRNNIGDIAGEVLEQGGSLTKQTGKQIVNESKSMAQTATSQVTGIGVLPTGEQKIESYQTTQNQTTQDQTQVQDVVKSMYEPTPQSQVSQNQQNKVQDLAQKYPGKTLEEIQKIESLTKKLHEETYYEPTFNSPKPQEERQGEKIQKEEEQKKEMEELQQKEAKKKQPIAVTRATNRTEAYRGVSG